MSGCTYITEYEKSFREKDIADCEEITWYRDKDGDGFGGEYEYNDENDLGDDVFKQCGDLEAPNSSDDTGEDAIAYVNKSGDCDDQDPDVHPDAAEDCATSYDDNCDGDLNGDDAENCVNWYADADGDGYGSADNFICDCETSDGYPFDSAGDCDDLNADVNPDAEEVCGDGVDNNCDSSANDCGLSSPHDLGGSETIYLGVLSKDYAGTNLGSGVLLAGSNDTAAVILSIEADFTAGDNVGRVDILPFGEGNILTSEATASIWGAEISTMGSSLIGNQDINGDGDHDLLIGASFMTVNGTAGVGAVSVFLGPLEGEITMNEYDYHFMGEASNDRFGDSATVWTGDSKTVWVGAPNYDLPLLNGGAVFIFDVNDGAIQSFSDGVMIASELGSSRFGTALSQAMDANGDGIPDVGVGAKGYDGSRGAVYVFWGEIAENRNALDADVIIRGANAGDEIGEVVDFVGDLTGSGQAELALSSLTSNTVYLFPANQAGEYTTADATVVIEGPADSETGYSMANVGDINGDSWDDFAIGSRIASSVYLLYGPLEGTYNLESDAIVLQDSGSDQVGSAVIPAGDVNEDGLDDFLIGAQISSRNTFKSGSVFLVEGEGL